MRACLSAGKWLQARAVAFALHDTDRVFGFKQGGISASVGTGDTLMNAGRPRLATDVRDGSSKGEILIFRGLAC